MSKLSVKDITHNGSIYGIPLEELSYRQVKVALDFANSTELWLKENISEFGEAWFVEPDKEYDSLRVLFKNLEDETYFKLSWMQQIREAE